MVKELDKETELFIAMQHVSYTQAMQNKYSIAIDITYFPYIISTNIYSDTDTHTTTGNSDDPKFPDIHERLFNTMNPGEVILVIYNNNIPFTGLKTIYI